MMAILLFSCNAVEQTVKEQTVEESPFQQALKMIKNSNDSDCKFAFIERTKDVETIVAQMAQAKSYEGARLGYAGNCSEVFAWSQRLCAVASYETIMSLLKHDSASVRVYAYDCLIKRYPDSLELAGKEVIGLFDKLDWFDGCTLMTCSVGSLTEMLTSDLKVVAGEESLNLDQTDQLN